MESTLQKIADNTERIARYTEPKSSFYILLSDKTTRLRTRFNPLIQFEKDKRYEMALVNLETYYSFPNIDATNNSFSYSPNVGGMWVTIHIPEGCYEITDINEYVQRSMKEKEHYDMVNEAYNIKIEANSNTLKTVLHIAENYMIDFWGLNSIGKVLGFDRRRYSAGYQESENIVDIMTQ